ncbi:MAG TPA: patatin-like phospholipase family protein [Vicinamibacterales bacterium]|nr:patatin-like phospholipase family protein [Vicinamibacterales bacterium]
MAAPATWYEAFVKEAEALQSTPFTPPAATDVLPTDPADVVAKKQLRALNADAFTRGRAALCLSGGGIRSASFSVGVLQALARAGLLDQFHYLSTVSGGGFAGSWLTAWRHRANADAAASAWTQLETGVGPAGAVEPWPVSRLREYTRYLSPHSGAFSPDFWTLIATMIRNLVLNWFVLVPLIAAAMLVPRLHYSIVQYYSLIHLAHTVRQATLEPARSIAFYVFVVGIVMSVGYTAINLPSFGAGRAKEPRVVALGVAPLCLGLLALLYLWVLDQRAPSYLSSALWGGVADGVSWTIFAVIWAKPRFRPRTWIAAALSGATIGYGMAVVGGVFYPEGVELHKFYVTFAFPLDLLVTALGIFIFVGFAGSELKPADLEWNSRFVAWVLFAACGWFAVCAIVFGGPWLVHWLQGYMPHVVRTLGGATAIMGGVGGWLTRPAGENVQPTGARKIATTVAMPVFALLLLVSIAYADDHLVRVMAERTHIFNIDRGSTRLCAHEEDEHANAKGCHPAGACLGETAILFVGLLAGAFVMNRFVPVNKFSLNAMYRHRLTRAYLGASRDTRTPNPFTGFDPHDDIELAALSQRPFHVVNVTLNMQRDQQLGRQDRQAESFTMTPTSVGCVSLGYRPSTEYARDQWNDRGLTLGQAITISGAAASSAMGSFSSPTKSFLMTLLNARLGLWLGNPGPAGENTWQRSDPKAGVGPIVREMLGLTTAENPYVYLSDGGHFDNLGLWEMIQRRCAYIVVVDGGCDPDYSFGDLANAVRQARIDHNVEIAIDTAPIKLSLQQNGNVHVLVGTITYPDSDTNAVGHLLYVKPTLSGNEPADVLNYAKEHRAFPNEPTTDQWFSEAQFESYRMLGYHSLEHLLVHADVKSVRELCGDYGQTGAASAATSVAAS